MTSTKPWANYDEGPIDPVAAAREVEDEAAKRRDVCDRDGAFPSEDVGLLYRRGLLLAPFPRSRGGGGLGCGDPTTLGVVLRTIGRGSLTLGRLYEGHVNAVALVQRYGSAENLDLLRQEALAGRPSGVWMAGEALHLERAEPGRFRLHGRKILCSGAGHYERPLVAAQLDGASVMIIPRILDRDRADVSRWRTHGMRGTATGTVTFDGIMVGQDEIVGAPGDYLRSPHFRGGAWRVLAVQLGGLEAIYESYRSQLRGSPHGEHPLQLARFGEASVALETARLWVEAAAKIAEGRIENAGEIDAYVDLARNAFEAAALRVIANTQKAIGLNAFLQTNPIEGLIRDLTTYLRQPALDVSLLSAATFRLRSRDGRREPVARPVK